MNGDERQLLTTLEFDVSEIGIDRGTMGNYILTRSLILSINLAREAIPIVISLLERATLESTNGRRIEAKVSSIKKIW